MRSLFGQHYDKPTPTIPLNKVQQDAKSEFLKKLASGRYCYEDTACPCGAKADEVVALADRFGLPVTNVICRSCGLIRIKNRLTHASYAEFYATEYRRLYVGADSEKKIEKVFQSQLATGDGIIQLLSRTSHESQQGRTVLEIGCSCGGILESFRRSGASVYGYDYDLNFLAFGRDQFGLDLRQGGVDDIEADRKFDIIVLSHVLEHVTDLSDFIEKVLLRLKVRGILYINVPGVFFRNYYKYFPFDFKHYLQNAHTYTFTKETLLAVLPRNCLEILHIDDDVRLVSRYKPQAERIKFQPSHDSKRYLSIVSFIRSVERKRKYMTALHRLKTSLRLIAAGKKLGRIAK